MNNLEEAKRLLKNAIATNDPDLILLANQLLEGDKDKKNESKTTPQPTVEDNSDFLAPIITNESPEVRHGGIPVNETRERSNSFHDDGSIADDIKTPDFKPTERQRAPYKTIQQTCQRCSRVVQVNPIHKRDYFVCDKCLVK